MNQPNDERMLKSLTQTERDEIKAAFLSYFQSDRKLASAGLSRQAPFNRFNDRALSEMLAALTSAGLLAKSGGRRDAIYQLTPAGEVVRDQLQPNP